MTYYQLVHVDGHNQYIEAPAAERYRPLGFGPFELYIFKQSENDWRICSAECGRMLSIGSSREAAEKAFAHRLQIQGIPEMRAQIRHCILHDGHAPGPVVSAEANT